MILKTSFPILLVLFLAHFRVMRLLLSDTFPPVAKLRDAIYLRFPPDIGMWMYLDENKRMVLGEDGEPVMQRKPTLLGELLSCHWCLGFWLGGVQALLYLINPTLCIALCLPFAVAGFTSLVFSGGKA